MKSGHRSGRVRFDLPDDSNDLSFSPYWEQDAAAERVIRAYAQSPDAKTSLYSALRNQDSDLRQQLMYMGFDSILEWSMDSDNDGIPEYVRIDPESSYSRATCGVEMFNKIECDEALRDSEKSYDYVIKNAMENPDRIVDALGNFMISF